MVDFLRDKGLYQVTMGIEVAPMDELKSTEWDNGNQLAHKLIGMSISNELQFCLP